MPFWKSSNFHFTGTFRKWDKNGAIYAASQRAGQSARKNAFEFILENVWYRLMTYFLYWVFFGKLAIFWKKNKENRFTYSLKKWVGSCSREQVQDATFGRKHDQIFLKIVLSDCYQSEELLIQKKLCSEYFSKSQQSGAKQRVLTKTPISESTQNKLFFVLINLRIDRNPIKLIWRRSGHVFDQKWHLELASWSRSLPIFWENTWTDFFYFCMRELLISQIITNLKKSPLWRLLKIALLVDAR